jgi:hypothetical protein
MAITLYEICADNGFCFSCPQRSVFLKSAFSSFPNYNIFWRSTGVFGVPINTTL